MNSVWAWHLDCHTFTLRLLHYLVGHLNLHACKKTFRSCCYFAVGRSPPIVQKCKSRNFLFLQMETRDNSIIINVSDLNNKNGDSRGQTGSLLLVVPHHRYLQYIFLKNRDLWIKIPRIETPFLWKKRPLDEAKWFLEHKVILLAADPIDNQ